MHACMSRPTHVGSLHGQDWMLERGSNAEASMTCIVQGTTPGRVHAEIFAWESGHA